MDNWLYSIKDWWARHGRNIKRYGLCVMIVIAGLRKDNYVIAWTGLFLAACFAFYDFYDGPYWQQRGQQVLFPSKFKKDAPPPPPSRPNP